MQHSPVEVKRRLLSALDEDNNVVDMAVVLEVMATLEQMHITKEALETTRLGKHINEMRKKTADVSLARRAKALVRRWRDMVIPAAEPATALLAPAVPQAVKRLSPPVTHTASPSRSSYPSSANTSPCLSRSATPALGRQISPGLPLTGRQPPLPPSKDDVANKRKRKLQMDERSSTASERPDKRPRINGQEDECSRDSITCEINPDVAATRTPAAVSKKPRRSRSTAPPEASFADLNEKLASVSRRVKTTRELLSELAERSGDTSMAKRASQFPAARQPPPVAAHLPSSAPSAGPKQAHDMSRNKSAHMARFLNSQKNSSSSRAGGAQSGSTGVLTVTLDDDTAADGHMVSVQRQQSNGRAVESAALRRSVKRPPSESRSVVASPPPPPPPLPTEAEILARLPPLNELDIVWSDDDEEAGGVSAAPVIAAGEAYRLAAEHINNVNGNTDHQSRFREWHETVVVVDSTGQQVPLLPYVIID